jgi:hypothetical protein
MLSAITLLSLALLVIGVLAYYANNTAPLYHLALWTASFYR